MGKKIVLIIYLFFEFLIFGNIYANEVKINSLENLTISYLKKREYFSTMLLEKTKVEDNKTIYTSYLSDSIKVFAKIQIPETKMPKSGYPVIIITHGRVGVGNAPLWNFGDNDKSLTGNLAKEYRSLGYVVVIPGYRGHGSINGEIAEGLEYLYAYDNESYLIPTFYAIDVVNLIEGIDSLNNIEISSSKKNKFKKYQSSSSKNLKINLNELCLIGEGQGGDVALTVLGIMGENTTKNKIKAASIWSGYIADRDSQLQTFGPMNKTIKAFISGDGNWTSEAKGISGKLNKDFIFGFPSEKIKDIDINSKNATLEVYGLSSENVENVIKNEYDEMYSVFNNYVRELSCATYSYNNKNGITHDMLVSKYIKQIGGYNSESYITEPLIFHFSDRDFNSQAKWNYSMVKRLRKNNIESTAFEYKGNTSKLEKSKNKWFSPENTKGGFYIATKIDDLFFNRKKY
ncbi:MAG: hypothetical protein WBG30_06810 [Psychrilyobacter sp.]|uniref:hypothetical protein n=1 Tax=Psychrilyobacter sp. TaxID=2586924 RepID=UPI003C73EB32